MRFFLESFLFTGVPSIILWHILFKYMEVRNRSYENFKSCNYTVKKLLTIILASLIPIINILSLGVTLIWIILSCFDSNSRWKGILSEDSKFSKFLNKKLN